MDTVVNPAGQETSGTKIVLPYAMPGCIRRAVGHLRRHGFGFDLVCSDVPEQAVFKRAEWMELGNHALEIPQLLCMAKRSPEILMERLHALFDIQRPIRVGTNQFAVISLARFHLTAGKPIPMQAGIVVERGEHPFVFTSEHVPNRIVCVQEGHLRLYLTHFVPQGSVNLQALVEKIDESMRATSDDFAVVPRFHISRWDEYRPFLGMKITGRSENWELGHAEAHTGFSLEPKCVDAAKAPEHVLQVQPPLLAWVKREGHHFHLPFVIALVAGEDVQH